MTQSLRIDANLGEWNENPKQLMSGETSRGIYKFCFEYI